MLGKHTIKAVSKNETYLNVKTFRLGGIRKMECKYCGNTDAHNFVLRRKGSQTGLYCVNCGKWLKWVGKVELRAIKSLGVKEEVDQEQNQAPNTLTKQHGKFICTYCGSTEYEKRQVSIHTGIYCKTCGKWHSWVKKSR